jgi:hypothetical protein
MRTSVSPVRRSIWRASASQRTNKAIVSMSFVELSGVTVASTALVITLFGLALRARSWTLWLMGYAAALLTLVLAWRTR